MDSNSHKLFRLTINRFSLLIFILTSVLPISILGFIHISFLHRTLNSKESFLKLIEHEEFVLFLIYLAIVFVCISIGVFCFKFLIAQPINKLLEKMELVSNNFYPEGLDLDSIFYEIKALIQRFNQMLHSLKKAEIEKKEFISSLSHDIKIPLLAEQKAFELLRDYNLDQEQFTKIKQSLCHNNQTLIHLINALLDSFKFESPEAKTKLELLDLKTLINESISSLYPLIQEHNLSIENNIRESYIIPMDQLQMKRVFHNIFMNAIENSFRSSLITINTNINPESIEINIQNTGTPIPKEEIASLFDKYSSYSKSKAGLGLGLYIAKLIILRHGGEIEAESDNDKTRFLISLPYAAK